MKIIKKDIYLTHKLITKILNPEKVVLIFNPDGTVTETTLFKN